MSIYPTDEDGLLDKHAHIECCGCGSPCQECDDNCACCRECVGDGGWVSLGDRWITCPECNGNPVNFRLLGLVMVAGFVCGALSLFAGWWGL